MPHKKIEHVRQVLTLLGTAGVMLCLKKCKVFLNGVNYLRHVICPGHLKVSTQMIDEVQGLQHPANLTELRSFFGFCNVFRRLVPNFACVAVQSIKSYGTVSSRPLTNYPTKKLHP